MDGLRRRRLIGGGDRRSTTGQVVQSPATSSYESLDERTVLIIDEAGMVYDPTMLAAGDDTSTQPSISSMAFEMRSGGGSPSVCCEPADVLVTSL